MELGKFNSFLYGILISACIIMMIVYIIWLCNELIESDEKMETKWNSFKGKVSDKWTDLKDWAASRGGAR